MSKLRTFIAIDIPLIKEIEAFIFEIKKELGHERIKWVDEKHLHITIKFLGDTESENLKNLIKNIKEEVNNYHQFLLNIQGFGVFQSVQFPKVLWIGIENNLNLTRLFNGIETQLEKFGYLRDIKTFVPHITIARLKNIDNQVVLKRFLEKYKHYIFGDFSVDEIVFYKSELSKNDPVYKRLSNMQTKK